MSHADFGRRTGFFSTPYIREDILHFAFFDGSVICATTHIVDICDGATCGEVSAIGEFDATGSVGCTTGLAMGFDGVEAI